MTKHSANEGWEKLSKVQALQKLRHFCTYQERCHSEVKEKLFELGIVKADQDEIIASLIEDNYLNEERFAIQFAGGKFRMKRWGKNKILYTLKEKQVSENAIKKALKLIENEEYYNVLHDLVMKKYALLKGQPYLIRKKKTMYYMLQKGFESDLVITAINRVTEKKKNL